jgi:Prokaryotic E2 family E
MSSLDPAVTELMLPIRDVAYLVDRGLSHEVSVDQGMTCLVVPSWPLPEGFVPGQADLLLRLSPGYPDVAPDMWWFSPSVSLISSAPIPGTQSVEPYFGRQWQRWSRHLPGGVWRSGVDGLESFFAIIRADVQACVDGANS